MEQKSNKRTRQTRRTRQMLQLHPTTKTTRTSLRHQIRRPHKKTTKLTGGENLAENNKEITWKTRIIQNLPATRIPNTKNKLIKVKK